MTLITASKSSPSYWRIGLDLMGSDTSPDLLLDAVLDEKTAALPLAINCFVQKKFYSSCKELLRKKKSKNITLTSCAHFISPEEDPLKAVLEKEDSTTKVGIFSLKNQELDAFISLGSTGALISASTLYLKRFRAIKRPVLVAKLPSKRGFIYIADVGGNSTSKAANIINSAFLSAAYAYYDNERHPLNLGLLNIGSEGHKGSSAHQLAFKEIKNKFSKNKFIQFVGNVEPNVAFLRNVDAIAADGLMGNIFLKTAEGMSEFIFEVLNKSKSDVNLLPLFDYSEYPGALIGGVEGLVFKCHGYSSSKTIFHTLVNVKKLLDNHFLEKYKKTILSWADEIP